MCYAWGCNGARLAREVVQAVGWNQPAAAGGLAQPDMRGGADAAAVAADLGARQGNTLARQAQRAATQAYAGGADRAAAEAAAAAALQ